MKVKVTENTKKALYMSEMENLEIMKQAMNDQEGVSKEDIQMFANFLECSEVLKAEAEYAKNARVYDYYREGTEHLDVWIEITAYNGFSKFVIAGAYLSDIWNIGGIDSEELKTRMFIRTFAKEQ